MNVVVTAVALGAVAEANGAAPTVVSDAYAAVKRLLDERGIDLSALERRPDSATQRAALWETLTDLGAAGDNELMAAARRLVEVIGVDAAEAGPAVGVDLNQVEAEFLRVQHVQSGGSAVIVERSRFPSGIELTDLNAGVGRGNHP
ncbi:hypothetical protein ACQPXM_25105 [Kribbella sp. CA-253562]|uniref:hypothetical protein n=1 Tax=Kribbella sp. CA-253562 TaxID=3239942 RepID=UPI003D91E72A